ncbi:MAG: hypothetical protein JXA42_14365 [Anaerolineales bacterium]|nr:hypothetical protein [Anaerolineales bacterium]
MSILYPQPSMLAAAKRFFPGFFSLVLLLSIVTLARQTAQATPPQQAILPPPTSQKVNLLGQTGGQVTDFYVHENWSPDDSSSLIYLPEGNALSIIKLDNDLKNTTVLSRISPNQGQIQGLTMSQDTAFLITPIGLVAIDVQDPYNPQILSFLPGGGESVKVAGDFAFVAARAAGLRVINVNKPGRPVLASSLPLPGKSLDLALDMETSLAYIAADEGGLRIIDISAPDLPREVASMELPEGVQQLELEGKKLALSSGDRIFIIDVSRPDNPISMGSYTPLRNGRRIKTDGYYAYVADPDGGLKIYDISGDQPLLLYAESGSSVYDVLTQGNLIYLADGENGIRILNSSNPTNPTHIAQIPLGGIVQGLDIYEDTLFAACGEFGLAIINITNPWSPKVLSHLDTDGDARDVKADENLAYVADGPSGLVLISLADKRDPELRGAIYTPGEAQAIGLFGTFIYVAADDGGLQIVDGIRPAAPVLIGALSLPEGQHAVDIAMVNKRAYLAIQGQAPGNGDSGLAIADVTFRDQPIILSRVSGPGMGVAVQGVTVMTVGGNQLMTVDARASSGPVMIGKYQSPNGAGGMDWHGNNLYMTSGSEGPELLILDMSNPARPSEISRIGSGAGGGQVVAYDDRVFLAAGRLGLNIIDLTQPEMLKISIYDPMDTLTRLAVAQQESGTIYGAGETGWSITNVQNPSLPQPLSRVQTDAPISSLAIVGNKLYATSTTRGLLAYDISDLTQPQFMGKWSLGTQLQDVLIRDGYLYLADERAGLRIIDPNPPESPTLLQTLPLSGLPKKIVQLDQDSAYVSTAKNTQGLRLLELGHPTHGVLPLGEFPADAQAIQVAWPIAYTLDGENFAVWELESADVPIPVTSFRINGDRLLLDGERAFVGSDAGHVSIIDVSNPASPRVLGMMGNTAAVLGFKLAESDTRLIVGLDATVKENNSTESKHVGQLRIWDIKNPLDPILIDTVEPLPLFTEMAPVSGKPRLVTVGESLELYDTSGKETITHVTGITLPTTANSLFLVDDLAYVGGDIGLVIIRGIQSDSPEIAGEYALDGGISSVVVWGDRGYLSLGSNGGLMIDISDPTAPKPIAKLPSPTGGALGNLILEETHLWAAWNGWVSWLDISQPQAGPSEIAAVYPGDLVVQDLAVNGTTAYMVNLEAGLVNLDVTDPKNPILLGKLDTPGQAYAVAIGSDNLGYIADGECGLRVVSLQDPSRPKEVGFWHTGYALDVQVLNDIVYIADIGELMALEYDPGGEPDLPPMPQSPQPADDALSYPLFQVPNNQLEITLEWGPEASHCDPLIYDIYLGTENPPPIAASGLVTTSFQARNLERGQTYYWQVVTYDRQGDQSIGPVWRFHLSTHAQPPPSPTVAPKPVLAPSQQNDILPLVGGMVIAACVLTALWWVQRNRAQV